MRRFSALVFSLVMAAGTCYGLIASAGPATSATSAAASHGAIAATAADGPWGRAREVPGFAALNAGHYAQVASVSCASAGNCAAGGYYADSAGSEQAFVVDEK